MRRIVCFLLVLFSVIFLFICFMWFLSGASGHNIPDRIDRETYCLMIFNILIIGVLMIVLKKIRKKE
ncbi:hypothetical protein SAMN05192550_1059 [Flavobacterium glycines]|uniref:Signal peptidase n=1 Tax=Flavobacterium glycines TaxID=551990 RepID=A0A1G8P7V1_9FLAO|nr:hypothetical protein [Flavobacterium glycines]SDI88388.1 hypothetical protein SAMN05192550_1059 [Flavobacterium glycines]